MIISLTGFMGCGKSSIGRRLSGLLSCSFVDLDSVIEEAAGCSITEIFAREGEEGFRKREKEALFDLVACPGAQAQGLRHCDTSVLALGGGTIMTPDCAKLVHEQTLCIYLRAGVDTLVCNLSGRSGDRPLLSQNEDDRTDQLQARIEDLMRQRSSIYEKTAHIILDTDGRSVEEITDAVLNLVKGRKD